MLKNGWLDFFRRSLIASLCFGLKNQSPILKPVWTFQAPDFKVQLKPTPKVEKKKEEVERETVTLKKIPDKPVSLKFYHTHLTETNVDF